MWVSHWAAGRAVWLWGEQGARYGAAQVPWQPNRPPHAQPIRRSNQLCRLHQHQRNKGQTRPDYSGFKNNLIFLDIFEIHNTRHLQNRGAVLCFIYLNCRGFKIVNCVSCCNSSLVERLRRLKPRPRYFCLGMLYWRMRMTLVKSFHKISSLFD